MKKLAFLCLAVLLLLPGCSGNSPISNTPPAPAPSSEASPGASPDGTSVGGGEKAVSDYFPMKPDVRMTYRGTGSEYAGFVSTVDYIGDGVVQVRANNGGTESVTVYTVDGSAVTKVFSAGETYYRDDFTARRTADSEPVIKAPLAVGTSWPLTDGSVRTITAVGTPVAVPYGAFKALEVTTAGADSTTTEYYAPGVGLIKRVFIPRDDPSSPVTSELEKFEDGSPLNENTRFYYPDFNNGRVAYIEKTVSFHTGDTVVSKFADEFRHVPEGSSLTPVLTKDAVFNSIAFDAASGVVTADLSKAFITGMNAGSALEGMILESLADTLGNYYKTDKIALTIDGGPYESGHFLFNIGDYLPARLDKAVEYTLPSAS